MGSLNVDVSYVDETMCNFVFHESIVIKLAQFFLTSVMRGGFENV